MVGIAPDPWVRHRRLESTQRRESPRHCIELGHGPGGIPQVLYAGGAPTLLCGVQQINLRIPDQVAQPLNAVQVMLGVELRSPTQLSYAHTTEGTTIAVK